MAPGGRDHQWARCPISGRRGAGRLDGVLSGQAVCRRDLAAADYPSIAEMQRVLRPGGTIIIVETLGTAVSNHPPADWLATTTRSWKQSGFHSRGCARLSVCVAGRGGELLSFFWDDEFGEMARRNNWIITPECTGIWWKEVQP